MYTGHNVEYKRTIVGIWLENLDDIGHKVGQLFVDLDLLLVLPNPIPLSATLVVDSLNITLHDANVVVDEMRPLAELADRHHARFIVLQGLAWFVAFFGLFRLSAGSLAPDVVSFEVIVVVGIVAHGIDALVALWGLRLVQTRKR